MTTVMQNLEVTMAKLIVKATGPKPNQHHVNMTSFKDYYEIVGEL